jgi:hypothetical protein
MAAAATRQLAVFHAHEINAAERMDGRRPLAIDLGEAACPEGEGVIGGHTDLYGRRAGRRLDRGHPLR